MEYRLWYYLKHDNARNMFSSQFLQNWGNHFAWAAPSGEEVNNDQFVTSIFDLFVEVSLKWMARKKQGIKHKFLHTNIMMCESF